MKFSIASSELTEAVVACSKATARGNTMLPILTGILVSATGDGVVFSATDLDRSIRIRKPCLVEEEGAGVVPGKLFADVVKALPDAAVTISSGENSRILVSCSGVSYDFRGLDAEDFPGFPEVDAEASVTMNLDTLRGCVEHVAASVGKDEARPILHGAQFIFGDQRLQVFSTDSYRISSVAVDVDGADDLSFVVPVWGLKDFLSFAGLGADVTLGYQRNQMILSSGAIEFVMRRAEGTFPNCGQLFKGECKTRAIVDKCELLAAIKRVFLVAQGGNCVVLDVDFDKQSIVISSKGDSGEARESISCEVEGESMRIGLNGAYFMDGVRPAGADTVDVVLADPLRPAVVSAEDGFGFRYLVMPMRL